MYLRGRRQEGIDTSRSNEVLSGVCAMLDDAMWVLCVLGESSV